jgi:hypothetical protein
MSELLGLEAAWLGPIVLRSPPSYIGGAGDERFSPASRVAQTDGITPTRPIPPRMRNFAPGS